MSARFYLSQRTVPYIILSFVKLFSIIYHLTVDKDASCCILSFVKRGWRRGTNRKAYTMASFPSYSAAAAALPADCVWSASFGYPGDGGYAEYHRDARGDRYIIQNGEFGDSWTMRPESPYGSNLPVFPCFYDRPTEDRFERVVERLMDRADNSLLTGKTTQAQYDAWVSALSRWSDSVKLEHAT